ncbi:hypothetical protein GCM10011491_46160 [Brucella endophytica]|uniref:Uncharacterized protein n=1 Tax=Brucella endophytica TaxID=1963359 RepID=A0A916STR1_9HYPH|nr:hypothetical protein GCM10011491_46160 [Brucella endophytica]
MIETIDHPYKRLRKLGTFSAIRKRLTASQRKKVLPFGSVEPKSSRQSMEEIIRYRYVASLLEPSVPRQTDTSQSGDFLATKASGSTAAHLRQANRFWRSALATLADEIRQRLSGRHAR